MTRMITTLLAASFLMVSAPALTIAGPIDNGDGSKTCNASGPSSGVSDGVCANSLTENEGYCDGGLSTEPGGGVTCAESRTQGAKIKKLKQNVVGAPKRKLAK